MKKLLGVIVLGLLWCNVGFATCGEDVKRSWKYSDNKNYAKWTFKNTSDKSIVMTSIGLYSKSDKIMSDVSKNIYLKPFGVANGKIYVGDLNLDVAGSGFTTCRYGKPEVKKQSSSSSSSGKKGSSGHNWWPAIIAGIFIAIVAGLATEGRKTKNEPSKKTKNELTRKVKMRSTEKNIIEIVWNGEETMSKTFWLYCILTTAVISFLSGLVLASLGAVIYILPVILIIWSNTGLWRSSEIYKNQKLSSKQPYGWATAAKVYVVLNYITTLSQIGLSINA